MATPTVPRDAPSATYDPAREPRVEIDSGERVVFETLDARAGSLFSHPVGTIVDLPKPPPNGNPLTGPVGVRGAEPGDALVIEIEAIRCLSPGWVGAHAHVHPASPDRIQVPRVRICEVTADAVIFREGIELPLRPMLGCIGIAPAQAGVHAGRPGRHGGNLDHPIVCAGARVRLPVLVPGGLLYIGDVHAAQGDGELSSTAIEVAAEVTVRVSLEPGGAPRWPWVERDGRIAVMTTGETFEQARREAVDAALDALERDLGLEPAEALGLLSAAADLRIGQAFGGMEPTVRLELPPLAGLQAR
jgi:amidase